MLPLQTYSFGPRQDLFKLVHLGKQAVGLRLKGLFVVVIISYTQYSEADEGDCMEAHKSADIFLAPAETTPIAGDKQRATWFKTQEEPKRSK